MSKPNLFIVGAMKAGTRTLHALLAQHPQIFMCTPGEPSRFVEGARLSRLWPRMHQLGYWRDERAYLGLFERAGAARIIGESSTNYAKLPWSGKVVSRLQEFSPAALIVYIMREPAARAVSHYWHAVMHDGESRPPDQALAGPGIYRDVSHYAMQIAPYLAAFGRARVYTLTVEAFDANPSGQYRALLEWLGVDAGFVPPDLAQRRHERPDRVWCPRTSWLARWMNRHAVFEIPERASSSMQKVARHLLMRAVDTRAVNLGDLHAALQVAMAAEVVELETLLERRFPEWQR